MGLQGYGLKAQASGRAGGSRWQHFTDVGREARLNKTFLSLRVTGLYGAGSWERRRAAQCLTGAGADVSVMYVDM